MLTHEQKKALINLEPGVTKKGIKVRLLGERKHAHLCAYLQCRYDEDGFVNVIAVDEPYEDIVGLWKDRKIDESSINDFLQGEPLKFEGGKCFIYYSHRDTELREYIVQEDKPNGRIWNVTEDELLEKSSYWSDSDEPNTTNNPTKVETLESIKIPKPIRYPGLLNSIFAVNRVEDRWFWVEFEIRHLSSEETDNIFSKYIVFCTEQEARTMCSLLNGELGV